MRFLFISFLLILFSCGNDTLDNEVGKSDQDSVHINKSYYGIAKIVEPVEDEEMAVLKKDGITLTEIKSENNKDAVLELNTKQFNEGENQLSFLVMGVQGYSISYLANNYSLSQFSSDIFEVEFLYGNNVFLAFLTDENGISIKTNKGCVLTNAVVGGAENLFIMNHPHLFYYLPKAESNEPILDFYMVNTAISESGNKVKVTINETEFIINKWAAYKISGLKKENNTVRIQLIDKSGNLIDGPFNDSGDRKF